MNTNNFEKQNSHLDLQDQAVQDIFALYPGLCGSALYFRKTQQGGVAERSPNRIGTARTQTKHDPF